MKSDSLVRDEVNRVHAKNSLSDFEIQIRDEIREWSFRNNIVYEQAPRIAINAFWNERLSD